MAVDIKPYRIEISEDALDDLKRRIAATRYPERETVDDWSQGTPLSYTRALADYWRQEYDWRKTERVLNELPQFTATLDGLDIHFLHIRSPEPDARPLIMTHGWPGSIIEFLDVIGPLADPVAHGGNASDAFHVVCPALPGYGFSQKPAKTGWKIEKIAAEWDTLMKALGYSSYFAQGGDWGAAVTTELAMQKDNGCAGAHVNMAIVFPDPATMNKLTDEEKETLESFERHRTEGAGYSKQQSTRPQTLGYGLTDSPVGQLAWIVEKFYLWTDNDGDPLDVIDKDRLLDNVMMYWLTAAATSSARLYWESYNNFSVAPVDKPMAVSCFPAEMLRPSERWVRKRFTDLRYYRQLDRGGHFAAMEQPELFVGEVRAAFNKMSL